MNILFSKFEFSVEKIFGIFHVFFFFFFASDGAARRRHHGQFPQGLPLGFQHGTEHCRGDEFCNSILDWVREALHSLHLRVSCHSKFGIKKKMPKSSYGLHSWKKNVSVGVGFVDSLGEKGFWKWSDALLCVIKFWWRKT